MSAFDWRAPIPSPCAYTCCCTSDRALLFRRFGGLFLHWLPILRYMTAVTQTLSSRCLIQPLCLRYHGHFPDIPGEAEQMMVGGVRPRDPAEAVPAALVVNLPFQVDIILGSASRILAHLQVSK
ncbi:uncharacterized protein CLUP02_10738 [Colletotrichum lupini]|uniref:Uncharacterized protein n=1 Tax=Colletotrichum lupini TaxID=145971 RepID=A0A9Q8SYX9_9PEZI|nr:uncharacterized protein CLUP02_10738 [Colletotrichum lupini]UQC85241.1 hypothetical protein CLUP02_10738 [Colletotrichum lupini]